MLMEDHAPGHDSWYTNSERQKAGIMNKVNWPSNSLDFNPIEWIWVLLRSRIQRRREDDRVTTVGRMREVFAGGVGVDYYRD